MLKIVFISLFALGANFGAEYEALTLNDGRCITGYYDEATNSISTINPKGNIPLGKANVVSRVKAELKVKKDAENAQDLESLYRARIGKLNIDKDEALNKSKKFQAMAARTSDATQLSELKITAKEYQLDAENIEKEIAKYQAKLDTLIQEKKLAKKEDDSMAAARTSRIVGRDNPYQVEMDSILDMDKQIKEEAVKIKRMNDDRIEAAKVLIKKISATLDLSPIPIPDMTNASEVELQQAINLKRFNAQLKAINDLPASQRSNSIINPSFLREYAGYKKIDWLVKLTDAQSQRIRSENFMNEISKVLER